MLLEPALRRGVFASCLWVKEREARAEQTKALYREFMANAQPPLTIDQFRQLLMCLHTHRSAATTRSTRCFAWVNAQKLRLTGVK
jgi:hypothetical protein